MVAFSSSLHGAIVATEDEQMSGRLEDGKPFPLTCKARLGDGVILGLEDVGDLFAEFCQLSEAS